MNLGFIKFGTTDFLQGAAILLTLFFLLLALVAIIAGMWNVEWAEYVLAWIATPLALALGVAIGSSSRSNSEGDSSTSVGLAGCSCG